MAKSEENNIHALLVEEIFTAIMNSFKKKKKMASSQSDISISDSIQPKLPSFMAIKIGLRLNKVNINKLKDSSRIHELIKEQPEKAGEALGQVIWNSRPDVRANKSKLEVPATLDEYRSGFPLIIEQFFDAILIYLQKKK